MMEMMCRAFADSCEQWTLRGAIWPAEPYNSDLLMSHQGIALRLHRSLFQSFVHTSLSQLAGLYKVS